MTNTSMRTSMLLLCSATLMACFPPPPDGGGGGNTPVDANPGVDPCTRKSASGGSDGFPFDVATFDSMVRMPLATGCQLGSACHGPGNQNRFTVFTDGDCPDVQTFNQVFELSDYQRGGDASRLVQAIDGTLAAHPIKPPTADELLAVLRAYIDTAKEAFEQGGGGG